MLIVWTNAIWFFASALLAVLASTGIQSESVAALIVLIGSCAVAVVGNAMWFLSITAKKQQTNLRRAIYVLGGVAAFTVGSAVVVVVQSIACLLAHERFSFCEALPELQPFVLVLCVSCAGAATITFYYAVIHTAFSTFAATDD